MLVFFSKTIAQSVIIGDSIFRTLENTRFTNSYKQINQIATSTECRRLCSLETNCKSVSFLWLSRNPNFSWYLRSAGNICYFFGTSKPASSTEGQQFFTSYVREFFVTLENTRFSNSYKQMKQIATSTECMRLCSSDKNCEAVSFLWLSRNPPYPRSVGNICYFYGTSKPATSTTSTFNYDQKYFTSYVRG